MLTTPGLIGVAAARPSGPSSTCASDKRLTRRRDAPIHQRFRATPDSASRCISVLTTPPPRDRHRSGTWFRALERCVPLLELG